MRHRRFSQVWKKMWQCHKCSKPVYFGELSLAFSIAKICHMNFECMCVCCACVCKYMSDCGGSCNALFFSFPLCWRWNLRFTAIFFHFWEKKHYFLYACFMYMAIQTFILALGKKKNNMFGSWRFYVCACVGIWSLKLLICLRRCVNDLS